MSFHDMSVYVISFQVMSSHLVAFMSFYNQTLWKSENMFGSTFDL